MRVYLFIALPVIGLVVVGCVIASIVTVVRGIGKPREE